MNLTEEDIKAIKEYIQRGLLPKQICTKYHVSPAQYVEIRNPINPYNHKEESRPAVV
jgi:hypothetical protein